MPTTSNAPGRLVLAALSVLAVACGPPRPTESICSRTLTGDIDVPTTQAADILVVVDNSSSMQEEQQNLATNFLNPDPVACPLQDLANIPADFKNPAPALYDEGGPLAGCGFIQLVAAYDNDFRVGVITTDVGLCDNRLPNAVPGGAAWGFRPQRGCLQPDGAPADANLHKVIARADLDDDDTTNDDIGGRFLRTLQNVGTFGTPVERGLDAMATFLDASADKNPACVDDLASFRRDNAQLVVIFLSDEEDCSHGLDGKLEEFGDENAGEVCGEFPNHFLGEPGKRCYEHPERLTPIETYRQRLLAADKRAKVAVIAGAVDGVPNGCMVGGDGLPVGGDDVCFQSGGLSNFTAAGQVCAADTADARGGLPCCIADSGSRYYAFADAVGKKATDSICNLSFRRTMLDIAAFIAAVDVVELAEEPANPRAILVDITHAGTGETVQLPLLPDDADCTVETGWKVEGPRIVLCGEGRGGPGDVLDVRAAGVGDPDCGDPVYEASGGGANCASSTRGSLVALGAMLLALAGVTRRRSRA